MTDGNLQPNRTERKFLFRSEMLCRLHSVPFGSAEKSKFNNFFVEDSIIFAPYFSELCIMRRRKMIFDH
uniref:Uncharacterized protein n=1 Tax=Romanomermis culicivorax TaxID=13658 RepID=A0A915KQP9_ROMCU